MKLISYIHNNKQSYGAVKGDMVMDLAPVLGAKASDVKALITNGLVGAAVQAASAGKYDLPLSQVTLLPPVPNPGKIFCVGLNYAEHVRETGREVTEKPAIFTRFADSQVGHGEALVRPPESVRFDYEGEIAIVIGKAGRRIKAADAWDHIIGYSCYNEGSIRDWQNFTTQWIAGKNWWHSGAFGPWLVTNDEIKPNQKMTLITRLNGVELQRATTDMMIHSIQSQIEYISTFTPLAPGDVIVTGTPGGVGNKRTPQLYMKPGDVVEIEVDAVGVLRNTIRDE
jgi:2-keto-4-pentenoate hydratase/2-oxohepta-3-ene-1,7-dioic acid hydratase in catechol pathway